MRAKLITHKKPPVTPTDAYMNKEFRSKIVAALRKFPNFDSVVLELDLDENFKGRITYNDENVWVDPSAPGFQITRTNVTDEELVRCYLLLRLTTTYDYPESPATIEIERVYKPVGRPTG